MSTSSSLPELAPRYISRLTRNTIALILAGGRGGRLSHLTDWRVKPAVPFGGKFRIIDFPLSNCINSGIRRIGILTQYKAHSLIRHIQRGWGFLRGEFGEFIELLPAQQWFTEEWYSGTADAVYQNLDIIRSHSPEYVLILAGDHIYKMDYGTMIATHFEQQADMTVGCLEVPLDSARAFGVMSVDEQGQVLKFMEKPAAPEPTPHNPTKALASMGIYVFNTDFLCEQLALDAQDPNSTHDFGKDIIPKLITSHRVFTHAFRDALTGKQAYWRDVGTVDAFWQANMEVISGTPDLDLYDKQWSIWTYQEQLPPAKFVDEKDQVGVAIDSMVSGGCVIWGAKIVNSLLFSNVKVEASSLLEEAVVLPNVKIGSNCRIRKAVIDKGCVIPDGTQIGVNSVEDKRLFDVSPNGVVLVTPDMLGQNLHHHY